MTNKNTNTKNLLDKYFPKVYWTCINEINEDGKDTGNLFYKGNWNNFTFEFYSRENWESLIIWFNNHHLLVESTKKDSNSTNEILVEGFNSLLNISTSINNLLN